MKLRGFALLTPERRSQIARQGGLAVPPEKRQFSRDRELARAAGSKGGRGVPPENRSFSRDRELAVRCGRIGGSVPKTRNELARDLRAENKLRVARAQAFGHHLTRSTGKVIP